ncbi:MAG: polyprenyl diphosphate synthase [Planctomycetota bacterium]
MADPKSPRGLPRAVAIIMDGNGRWARRRGLLRTKGHEQGVRAVRDTVTECARLGLEALTLYAFSAENWKRPRREVRFLMDMLQRFLVEERPTLMDNGVRLLSMGRLEQLPDDVLATLRETEALTAGNDGLRLCLALSYGGRQELVDAARRVAREVREGLLDPEDVDEACLAERLYRPELPDPDLLIRTAGELRVSNFLLWQISYAEFWVTERCWPEFGVEDLHRAFAAYEGRVRSYGGLPDQGPAAGAADGVPAEERGR